MNSNLESGPVAVAAKPARLDSVDLLRGVIMVVMALDHVRDFFSNVRISFHKANKLGLRY